MLEHVHARDDVEGGVRQREAAVLGGQDETKLRVRIARALERGRGRIDTGDDRALGGEAPCERAIAAAQVQQPPLTAAGLVQPCLEQAPDVLVYRRYRVLVRYLPPDLVVNAQAGKARAPERGS